MSPVAKNILRYLILAVVSSAAILVWDYLYPEKSLHLMGWVLIAMFTLVYAAAHYYITAGEKGSPGVFVRRFMGATTLRLLFFMVFIMAWSFTHRPQAVVFICHFLALYLLYTVVEVSAFYTRFSNRS